MREKTAPPPAPPRRGGPLLVALALAFLGLAAREPLAAAPPAGGPDKTKYQATPFLTDGEAIPEVLLILSKDHKMFQQAYGGLMDMDGDGRIDTGFNPEVVYYGYFDSYSCYDYQGRLNQAGDPDGYFQRVDQPPMEDEPRAALESARAARGVRAHVGAARSATGICQGPHAYEGGYFSGNWLNYVTTTRMDVIRKILYGGFRQIDTERRTVLESSFVPNDAHVWGTDVMSDSRWNYDSPLNPYYDISKYTPFPKPKAGRAHFFARVRSDNFANYPTLRYVLDVDQHSFQPAPHYGGPPCGNHPTDRGRYFDWVMDNRPNPSDARLNAAAKRRLKAYTVRVEVCRKGGHSPTEGCLEYPNGALKPAGLLQKYGAGDKMYFGLLTGSYKTGYYYGSALTGVWRDDYRRQGGVLRRHLDSIDKSVDPDTGLIKKPAGRGRPRTSGSLVWILDTLRISGRDDDPDSDNYANADSWGNPIGEMLYEGARYFARRAQPKGQRALRPTPSFLPDAENPYNDPGYASAAHHPAGYADYLRDWNEWPALSSEECGKPVILLISETDSDFDGDLNARNSGLSRPPLAGLPASRFPDFSLSGYLKAITDHEAATGGLDLVRGRYFYAADRADDCRPKPLSSLEEVRGICPNSPAFEGGYSAAAAAYYAHTHDFSAGRGVPIDVYAVTMSGAFPELSFPVTDSSGRVVKKISILPASMSARGPATTNGRIIGFVNYYILDWKTDRRGLPYHIKFRVNFEDAVQGWDPDFGSSDWDMDIIMEYTIDLVTTAATSLKKREAAGLDFSGPRFNGFTKEMSSGALKVKGGTYYKFKDPGVDRREDFYAIEPGEAAGLIVRTRKVAAEAGLSTVAGYTISGSTHDGTYMDRGHRAGVSFKYATPPSCDWPAGYGAPRARGSSCLNSAFKRLGPDKAQGDGPEDLAHTRTFEFDPQPRASGEALPNPLWLAAKYGGFEDRDHNGRPDPGEWEGPDGSPKNYFQATNIAELPDKLEQAFQSIARGVSSGTAASASINSILGGGISIQTLYYPEYRDPMNDKLKIRWAGDVFGLFVDKWGNLREDSDQDGRLTLKTGRPGEPGFPKGDLIVTFDSDPAAGQPIVNRHYDEFGSNDSRRHTPASSAQKLKTVWDASRLLAEGDPDGRAIYYGPHLKPFKASELPPADLAELAGLMIHPNTRDFLPGPADDLELAKKLIGYLRGGRVAGWRPREVGDPWKGSVCDPASGRGCITWRLGDVVNSKPIIVGAPAFNYDLLYGDSGYYEYKKIAARRRQVAYFGANDGFLHAVNLGFYGSLAEGRSGYDRADPAGKGRDLPLGREIWAYAPTAVLPHLQWLADPGYSHSYYVDLKPLIADMRLGRESDPGGGWRTVLIGGLRLGGREIEVAPPGVSYAEVFALDITDPEKKPELLWRYSAEKLGLNVGLPAAVVKDGRWYVVLASGPKAGLDSGESPYDGYSDQRARVIILDAKSGREAGRAGPDETSVPEERSFFNDAFVLSAVPDAAGGGFSHQAVYYGLTVSRQGAADSGAVYRLDLSGGDPRAWRLKRLINVERPVTGAVNAARDGRGRLWIFFGTGRLWSRRDLRPCAGLSGSQADACGRNHRQYLYGVKEPQAGSALSFEDLTTGVSVDKLAAEGRLIDVSGAKVFADGFVTGLTGRPGLPVSAGGRLAYAALAAAIGRDEVVGFRRALDTRGVLGAAGARCEMALTQPKIDNAAFGESLLAFTTYEPPESACGDEGRSYLHLVDAFTGLPVPRLAAIFPSGGTKPPAGPLQAPGYVEAGGGKATEAVIVKADGATVIRASGQDGGIYDLKLPKDDSRFSGLISWREILDMGFLMKPEDMTLGLGR